MSLRYYVASRLRNAARVIEIQQALDKAGHRCVHDWASKYKQGEPEDVEAEVRAEAHAISLCDIFILVAPYARGAATELGIAIASKAYIILFYDGKHDADFHDFAGAFGQWHAFQMRHIFDVLPHVEKDLEAFRKQQQEWQQYAPGTPS